MLHDYKAGKCHRDSREFDKLSTFTAPVWTLRHLDGFVRVGDEGDEERQHHVDEE